MKNLPKINSIIHYLYLAEARLEQYEFQSYINPIKGKGEVMNKLMELISILEDEHYHVAQSEAEGFV